MKPSFLNKRLFQLSFAIAVALAFQSARGLAATIDLTGIKIQNGNNEQALSEETLAAASQYSYSISGNVHGTEHFKEVLPAGTSIENALEILGVKDFPLSGEAFRADGALKGPVFKRKLKGKYEENFLTKLNASADVAASITDTGVAKFTIKNTSVILNGIFGKSSNNSSIVFEEGALLTINATTSINPLAQPDLLFPNGFGNNVYEKPAQEQFVKIVAPIETRKTFSFYLQNDSLTPQTYSLKLPSSLAFFGQLEVEYSIDGEKVSGGTVAVELQSLEIAKVVVKATLDRSAPKFDTVDIKVEVNDSLNANPDTFIFGMQRK